MSLWSFASIGNPPIVFAKLSPSPSQPIPSWGLRYPYSHNCGEPTPTPYTLHQHLKPYTRNSSFCLSPALLSQLLGLLHDLFSQLVHTLFMTCSWLVHQLVHDLFMTSLQLVHDLFMTCSYTCSWLVYDLFTNCSRLVHDLFKTCSWLVHHLLMTCLWLVLT